MLPKFDKIPTEALPQELPCEDPQAVGDSNALEAHTITGPTAEETNCEVTLEEPAGKEPKKYRNSKRHRKIAASLARSSIDPNSPLIYLRSSRVNID